MKTLSLKLPEHLHALLHAAVQERHKAKSELVREALAAYLADTDRPGSFAALTDDLSSQVSARR